MTFILSGRKHLYEDVYVWERVLRASEARCIFVVNSPTFQKCYVAWHITEEVNLG